MYCLFYEIHTSYINVEIYPTYVLNRRLGWEGGDKDPCQQYGGAQTWVAWIGGGSHRFEVAFGRVSNVLVDVVEELQVYVVEDLQVAVAEELQVDVAEVDTADKLWDVAGELWVNRACQSTSQLTWWLLMLSAWILIHQGFTGLSDN